jgi:hypothetical protein
VGEEVTLFGAGFNRSLRVEMREERLTSNAGAVVLREAMERLGVVEALTSRLSDPRSPEWITHPLSELLRSSLLLLAQGHRDQDDADLLRDDGVLRLAVSDRRGIGPLMRRQRAEGRELSKNPEVPDGLASQPTLSRLMRTLSSLGNRQVLREELTALAARRFRASRGGHRQRDLTLDVDSLPIEVHGHQPGSEYNGHYHSRIYHPLIATIGETGDIVDGQLRAGNAHTAEGALDFILPLVDRLEQQMCQIAAVRMDAGFPAEPLLDGLETRRIPYVARVRNNRVLDSMAAPYLRRPVGRPPAEPRTFFYELSYQAESWSRPRRVVLLVLEREDDLFLHHFWLITNWADDQMPAADLCEHYRERGTAEGHMGEMMDVLNPALSSAIRPKSHYRKSVPVVRYEPGEPFEINEALLLMNLLAYEITHAVRVSVERATGRGYSLRRIREQVLRVAGRVLLHARRAVLIIETRAASLWRLLWPVVLQLDRHG